jgi:lauroyl/myristoyl acyltransferase
VTDTRSRGRVPVLAYRAGARVAQALPTSVAEPLAAAAGRTAARVLRERHDMVARHQQRVRGGVLDDAELERAVRATFASYGRYWLELLRLPAEAARRELDDHVDVEGFEHIQAALDVGHGVVLGLPHLGGWEYAGAWLATQGHPPLAVAEPLDPPEVFDWFVSARAAMGIDVVALGEGSARALLAGLRANRVVTLVCDRDLTGDGVPVDFFGERTTLPGGPATLCLRTGAALLPAAVYFRPDGGHHAVVRPPMDLTRTRRLRDDVARVTQALAHELEELVGAAPEQWHLMQPNWPSDRAGSTVGSAPCG